MLLNKLAGRMSKAMAVACLMGALGAATASATPVPATFSSNGNVSESNTSANPLKWYVDGVYTGSCTPNLQGAGFLYNGTHGIGGTVGSCLGNTPPLWFQLTQNAWKDDGAYSLIWSAQFVGFPGYTVMSPTFTTTWTNGSGSTPSTISFNNVVVGTSTNGHVISMSGVLNVTRLDGSLLTLS
ncbi:MAG TPA: hypothetical protein VFG42_24245 [Baekduia sp.]|uniref:hypothetical protein n=1 Tax=Baekduia sp. TaxID=2600305 RepID=UPI002D775F20|nr:hypothetical protein [Baekduia sp.]HET6509926.1 hypothetical protein [Baekduia sp.]